MATSRSPKSPTDSPGLLDAAFAAAMRTPGTLRSQRERHRQAKATLAAAFGACSRVEVARAYVRAHALVRACYDVGDRIRAGVLTWEQAELGLAEAFPGFSEAVYVETIAYGLFVTR